MNADLYTQRKNSPVLEFPIAKATDEQLTKINNELTLGFSIQELKEIQAYFKGEKREPTDVELQTISQTWSEHCCHKTFRGKIVLDGKEINSLFKTYIAKATKQIRAPWCVSVFEDNAGIVKFDKGYGIAAKVETHNHPSAVEPFGGAATGVGGVIRDILGVWADPIACTDVLGFGPLDHTITKSCQQALNTPSTFTVGNRGHQRLRQQHGHPNRKRRHILRRILHRQRNCLLRCIGVLPLLSQYQLKMRLTTVKPV